MPHIYSKVGSTEILPEGRERMIVSNILSEQNKIFIACFTWEKPPLLHMEETIP